MANTEQTNKMYSLSLSLGWLQSVTLLPHVHAGLQLFLDALWRHLPAHAYRGGCVRRGATPSLVLPPGLGWVRPCDLNRCVVYIIKHWWKALNKLIDRHTTCEPGCNDRCLAAQHLFQSSSNGCSPSKIGDGGNKWSSLKLGGVALMPVCASVVWKIDCWWTSCS